MKLLYSFLLAAFFVLSCSSPKQSEPSSADLENGLYRVVNDYSEKVTMTEKGPIVEFSHDFLKGNTDGQPLYLEIDTTEFVRLDLKHKPEGIVQEDNRINLMITLTDQAGTSLANFTEKHLNKRVAIVIGGKAVTMHKVRSKIDGGKLQITRCTDNACEHLLLELKKNYD